MSIADYEVEMEDIEDFCNAHYQYYLRVRGCAGCANDEADRQHDGHLTDDKARRLARKGLSI